MPMKTYTHTTNNKKNKSEGSTATDKKSLCPCFTCRGKAQSTWQDVGNKRWYCKTCWDEYDDEEEKQQQQQRKQQARRVQQPTKKKRTTAPTTDKPVKTEKKPKKENSAKKHQKPNPTVSKKKAEKKQDKKKQKQKPGEKKKKTKPVPPKRREEELAWASLEELAREASRMRDTPVAPSKVTSTATITTTTDEEPASEKKKTMWCHPDIAKTREQICVDKKWMAHSKKAMYRSALESVAKAAKEMYTPPPPPPAPPATTATTTTSEPAPEAPSATTTENKKKKNKSKKKSTINSEYAPFPVESLAFLPSLIHAVEGPKTTNAPEVERLLTSFLEKSWDQDMIQKEREAMEEATKKLREERAAKMKEKIAKKEAEAAARALILVPNTPSNNAAIAAELPFADDAPETPADLAAPAVEGEQPPAAFIEPIMVAIDKTQKQQQKKMKKPKMPKISQHMILRALPAEIQRMRNERQSFMNQLRTYVNIITRTGVTLSVGITALYIVYSHCNSHDLYALLIRFQEHFQRCAPAQNQAVSYVINLAGSLVVNMSSSSSATTTAAAVSSHPYETLLRAREKLQSIFEEYMDDHKERAIKSAIVEPSEFIGFCSGDASAANHVEANGRWVYLTAVTEGLGGGSDRIEAGSSTFQLPLPVLQGEDQYQIGTLFAWDAIKEDEAAAFKDPLHFGTSGFRNVKLLKERAAEGGRTKTMCRDYRYQSDKGALGNVREMFQIEKEEYNEELKLWAKNIDAFAFFFSKDFFTKRCFETLNTESRPEYAGFRAACFTVFEHYLLASAVREDATCTELMKKRDPALSIEDQLYEYCYADEYCTELNVDHVFNFFQWLGITTSCTTPCEDKNQEEVVEGPRKCGLECYLEEIAAAKKKKEEEEEQKNIQQQQPVEVKEEEAEGYGETKQQHRQDDLTGRRRNNNNKRLQNKQENQSSRTVEMESANQKKQQEEEVAPPPMLIDDGFALSKTKSFEIEPEPPLFVV